MPTPPGTTTTSSFPASAQRQVGHDPESLRAHDRARGARHGHDLDVVVRELLRPGREHLPRPRPVELLRAVEEVDPDPHGVRPPGGSSLSSCRRNQPRDASRSAIPRWNAPSSSARWSRTSPRTSRSSSSSDPAYALDGLRERGGRRRAPRGAPRRSPRSGDGTASSGLFRRPRDVRGIDRERDDPGRRRRADPDERDDAPARRPRASARRATTPAHAPRRTRQGWRGAARRRGRRTRFPPRRTASPVTPRGGRGRRRGSSSSRGLGRSRRRRPDPAGRARDRAHAAAGRRGRGRARRRPRPRLPRSRPARPARWDAAAPPPGRRRGRSAPFRTAP